MIQPTANFVLVEFRPKNGLKIISPDGSGMNQGTTDIIVLAVGPDVPQNPPLEAGDRIILRGDAKIFPVGGDRACISYPNIMAIDEPDPAVRGIDFDHALVEARNGN